MLLKFQDSMNCRGTVPYDEISNIREDNEGLGILRLKSKEVIVTNMLYVDLMSAYEAVVAEDLALMMGDDDMDDIDV